MSEFLDFVENAVVGKVGNKNIEQEILESAKLIEQEEDKFPE